MGITRPWIRCVLLVYPLFSLCPSPSPKPHYNLHFIWYVILLISFGFGIFVSFAKFYKMSNVSLKVLFWLSLCLFSICLFKFPSEQNLVYGSNLLKRFLLQNVIFLHYSSTKNLHCYTSKIFATLFHKIYIALIHKKSALHCTISLNLLCFE